MVPSGIQKEAGSMTHTNIAALPHRRGSVTLHLFLLLAVSLLLAGCGDTSSPAQQSTPTPTINPEELTSRIMQATRETSSFHFTIDFQGKPVFADPNETFEILDIEGDLERPNAALVKIRVRNVGSIIAINLVSLEGQLYVTNPVTREWRCLEAGMVFDPIVLFDPERGIDYLIREHFAEVQLLGIEELGENNQPHYHLTGTINDPSFYEVSYGMIGAEEVVVDVWADTETLLVSQLVMVDTASDEDDPSTWAMRLSNYNQERDIRAPVECE